MTLIATNEAQRQTALTRLNRYVTEGQARAVEVMRRVVTEVPSDHIVRAEVVDFGQNEAGDFQMMIPRPGSQGCVRGTLHRNALGQIVEKVGMRDMRYTDHLLSTKWGRNVLAMNLREGIREANAGSKFLVRGHAGQVRGFLSSKFRRIDARPIADTLIGEAKSAGAIVTDAVISDVKVEMKFIVPQVFEPSPGEFLVFGFSWGNSDYGCGANWLRAFALRLMCFNGATLEQMLRQVHLGRELSEDVEWSAATLASDTKTATLAARDTARTLLSPMRIKQTADLVTRAAQQNVDVKAMLAGMKKQVGKAASERIATAYNSPDVEELPAGNTLWRFSNAISLVARDEKNVDEKIDLERLAGDILRA
jgi:hypothetical protein